MQQLQGIWQWLNVNRSRQVTAAVHLDRAKSFVLATDDQLFNLEVALMSKDLAQWTEYPLGLLIRLNQKSWSHLNLTSLSPINLPTSWLLKKANSR